MNGVFSVYKEIGTTSNDTVGIIRKILSQKGKKIKVGHGGTLDKNAEGVLVIGVGNGCKELHNFLKGDKQYIATGVFGERTDTLDATGEIIKKCEFKHITVNDYENVLKTFIGEIDQVPPLFSALKIKGKRASDLIREGEKVELPPRKIKIYDIKSKGFMLPEFRVKVSCGGGTYIRSLVRDIGDKLDSCAYMKNLIRIKQGDFVLENTLKIHELSVDSIKNKLINVNVKRL